MRIDTHRVGAVTVLEPHGPIVQDDADAFRQRLDESLLSSMGRLLVDVTHVPFVDSKGLEALADAAEQLGKAGGALRLAGANETLRIAFELTELNDQFDHFQDVNAAARSFL